MIKICKDCAHDRGLNPGEYIEITIEECFDAFVKRTEERRT